MKRAVAGFIIAVTVASVGGVHYGMRLSPRSSSGVPLQVMPSEVVVGKLLLYEESAFQATLRNNGVHPLDIARLTPSCGCTSVNVEKHRLLPGEETLLYGTLRQSPRPGPFQHKVLISTAKPYAYQTTCIIVGEVTRRISTSPETVVLKPDLLRGRRDSAVVVVHNGSQQTVRLETIEGAPSGVTAEWEVKDIASGGYARLTVTAASDVVVGGKGELTIRCSHPLEKTLSVPLELQPLNAVVVKPEVIHLGVLSRSELKAVGRLAVDVEGGILPQCDVTGADSPAYLQMAKNGPTADGAATRRFEFRVLDAKLRTDLSGTIRIRFFHRPSERTFLTTISLSGFLTDPVSTK